jgi:regulator of replication initiation timing
VLEEENSMLKLRCRKMGELEDRVEVIVKQNSELLLENEKMSKLIYQKKTELEALKNKYENTINQRKGN